MTQHTQRPWNVIHNVYGTSRYAVMQDSGVIVAEITDWPDDEMCSANARLIAAAPALLAALEDIVSRNEIQSWFNLDKARAAIALTRA